MNTSAKDTVQIILFDGVCNLCNGWVDFLMRRDRREIFKFAALQSESGKRLVREHHLPEQYLGSVILIADAKAHKESEAVLRILISLGGIWGLSRVFLILPLFFRDALYQIIARNRYRFFGKRESCRVPTAEERLRFLP